VSANKDLVDLGPKTMDRFPSPIQPPANKTDFYPGPETVNMSSISHEIQTLPAGLRMRPDPL